MTIIIITMKTITTTTPPQPFRASGGACPGRLSAPEARSQHITDSYFSVEVRQQRACKLLRISISTLNNQDNLQEVEEIYLLNVEITTRNIDDDDDDDDDYLFIIIIVIHVIIETLKYKPAYTLTLQAPPIPVIFHLTAAIPVVYTFNN